MSAQERYTEMLATLGDHLNAMPVAPFTRPGWTARDCGDTHAGHRFYFDHERAAFFSPTLKVYGPKTLWGMKAAMTKKATR